MKLLTSRWRAWCAERAPSYAYLAFALLMLRLVRRGADKDVVRENILGFFEAVIPTELADKLLGLNAAALWWLWRRSAPTTGAPPRPRPAVLGTWIGSLAALIQCVAVIRLAGFQRANLAAKTHIRAAMADAGFAPEALATIGNLSVREWLAVLLPVPQSMALRLAYPDVRKIPSLTYAHVGEHRTTRLKMDVYRRHDCPSGAPIFLYVHGGAWIVGTRERPPFPTIYQVANAGWVVCSVDYRLSPKVAFPEHLVDIKRAIAFLRVNARAKFDANPDFIVVGGESAGGHLASLVALTPTDKTLQPGFEDVDTSVRGCVDTYGVHDFLDRHGLYYYKDKNHGFRKFMELVIMQRRFNATEEHFDHASPISWLMEDKLAHAKQRQVVPPFLLSHGTHDTLVPFDDSAIFYEKLQRYRQRRGEGADRHCRDAFLELPGAHHAFNYLLSPRSLAYGHAVCVFLQQLHSQDDKSMSTSASLPSIEAPVGAVQSPTATSKL